MDTTQTEVEESMENKTELTINTPFIQIKPSPKQEQIKGIFNQEQDLSIFYPQMFKARKKHRMEFVKPMILPKIKSKSKKSHFDLLNMHRMKIKRFIGKSLNGQQMRVVSPLPSRRIKSQLRNSFVNQHLPRKDHLFYSATKQAPLIVGYKVRLENSPTLKKHK